MLSKAITRLALNSNPHAMLNNWISSELKQNVRFCVISHNSGNMIRVVELVGDLALQLPVRSYTYSVLSRGGIHYLVWKDISTYKSQWTDLSLIIIRLSCDLSLRLIIALYATLKHQDDCSQAFWHGAKHAVSFNVSPLVSKIVMKDTDVIYCHGHQACPCMIINNLFC